MPGKIRIGGPLQQTPSADATVPDAGAGGSNAPLDPRAQVRLGEVGLSNFPPYLMNRLMGRQNTALRSLLAAEGLTLPALRALAVLSVIEGPLIRDLAAHAVIEQSTLSRALDALADGGLIRREPDPQDSRGIRIHLTGTGREVFERAWPHMAQGHARMFRGIPDDEYRAFVTTLQRLLANIEQPEG